MLEELGEWYVNRMKLRLMFGVIALFIASIVASCNEMRYLAFGQTINAKVDGMHNSRSGVTIAYSFPDGDAGTRKEDDDVSSDLLKDNPDVFPGDGTVMVQYIPGAIERSRVKGHNYAWLTIPLVITGVLATIFGIRFWRDFQDNERRAKAQRALYDR